MKVQLFTSSHLHTYFIFCYLLGQSFFNLPGSSALAELNSINSLKINAHKVSASSPPCSITYLSELEWEDDPVNGSGPIKIDQSNENQPLTIDGQVFPFGLGVHANSQITYQINGAYQYFRTTVGLDDETGDQGSVQFEVYRDGTLAWQSPVLFNNDEPLPMVLNVVGVQELTLVVNDAGDNNFSDHANWADARLEVCDDECVAGMPCDDGDPCTEGDVFSANCNCSGTTTDTDQDTVCDRLDQCPGYDDLADADGDGIPDACDTSPCSNILLTGLSWLMTPINGSGPVEINQSVGEANPADGQPMLINGQAFQYGLGVHANSEITYQISGQYEFFTAFIGVDDEVGDAGAVQFEVYTDNILAYQSPLLTGADDALPIVVNVEGAELLKLVVNDGGNTPDNDHANWALPQLEVCSTFCTPGLPCDDGDACTSGDAINEACRCEGVFQDADADGVCDVDDQCPAFADYFDADLDGIPDQCDDTPCADQFISDLNWLMPAINGFGPIMRNLSNEGRTMSINGRSFDWGLGVHAYSEITYLLNGQFEFFRCFIGLDDESDSEGSIQFEVYADGARVLQSPIMTNQDDAISVFLNIAGVNELKLVVTDGGDDIFFDHANWADAQLLCGEACVAGTPCDDNLACTINDLLDQDCNCAGTPVDADGDGICDEDDQCPGFDDTIDVDQDGIPDGCAIDTEEPRTDQVYLPNVFSPNGDGINDDFSLYVAPNTYNLLSMHIFDRWGNLVFETFTDTQTWDGLDIQGRAVPQGVYIYRLNINTPDGETEMMVGNITVLR